MRTKQYIEEINKYSEQLNEENGKKFEQILLKVRFSNINPHDAEDFSHHCLSLFLQAEKTKTPIEEVLGTNDLDSFCKDFIKGTQNNYSFFEKIYWYINYLPMVLFLFTGIWEMFIGYLIKAWVNKQTLFTVPFTSSMLVDTLLSIAVIVLLFKNCYYFYSVFNGDDKRKDRIATFLLWLGFCVLTGIFVLSKLFLTKVLFNINYLAFMGITGLIWLLQNLAENRNIK